MQSFCVALATCAKNNRFEDRRTDVGKGGCYRAPHAGKRRQYPRIGHVKVSNVWKSLRWEKRTAAGILRLNQSVTGWHPIS